MERWIAFQFFDGGGAVLLPDDVESLSLEAREVVLRYRHVTSIAVDKQEIDNVGSFHV